MSKHLPITLRMLENDPQGSQALHSILSGRLEELNAICDRETRGAIARRDHDSLNKACDARIRVDELDQILKTLFKEVKP